MDAVKHELEEAGFKTSGGQDNAPFEKDPISIDSFNSFPMDKDVGALLIGLDQNFDYTRLCLGSLYVQTGKAKMVCTNADPFIKVSGRNYPGTGSIVEAI